MLRGVHFMNDNTYSAQVAPVVSEESSNVVNEMSGVVNERIFGKPLNTVQDNFESAYPTNSRAQSSQSLEQVFKDSAVPDG